MLYRNLMAMDTEEMIRAHPLDGVVLLASCDKTIPAQLMGAASADVPAILLTGGPMLSGRWNGQSARRLHRLPSLLTEDRAGNDRRGAIREIEDGIGRSDGHCTVMGTASTMAAIAEALGMSAARDRGDPRSRFPRACAWPRRSAGRSCASAEACIRRATS